MKTLYESDKFNKLKSIIDQYDTAIFTYWIIKSILKYGNT